MFKRLEKVDPVLLKHVATGLLYNAHDIDRERYTEMPGLEGSSTRSGKTDLL